MSFTFLLMRHAYSSHNFYKDEWKNRNSGNKSYKLLPEFNATKFSPHLIDSAQIDTQQCQAARTTLIDFSKVGLVLCSPLKRCLQTCRQVLSGQEADIPVLVQPLLSNRLSASWSIGSTASSLASQYKEFDFSEVESYSESWMVKVLQNLNRFSQHEMADKKLTMQQYLLQILKEGQGENYLQFFDRTRVLRERIQQIINTFTLRNPHKNQILIISHSCVLSFLLGNELNEKGKVKNKVSFSHCKPVPFESSQVLGTAPLHETQ